MILLDENIVDSQRRILQSQSVRIHQIGHELGRSGMKDREIVPFLHRLKRCTFFTQDQDFFDRRVIHPRYSIVLLDVRKAEAALFIRRFLRHPCFRRFAQRRGNVIRVAQKHIAAIKGAAGKESFFLWTAKD